MRDHGTTRRQAAHWDAPRLGAASMAAMPLRTTAGSSPSASASQTSPGAHWNEL